MRLLMWKRSSSVANKGVSHCPWHNKLVRAHPRYSRPRQLRLTIPTPISADEENSCCLYLGSGGDDLPPHGAGASQDHIVWVPNGTLRLPCLSMLNVWLEWPSERLVSSHRSLFFIKNLMLLNTITELCASFKSPGTERRLNDLTLACLVAQ